MIRLAILLTAFAAPVLADAPPTVAVVIDYGDGVEKRFGALPHRQGLTALDAMLLAQKHPRGIRFEQRGRGAAAFLTAIDGQKNEGASGRNWIYRVNGKLGTRSFGLQKLAPGDQLKWTFERYP